MSLTFIEPAKPAPNSKAGSFWTDERLAILKDLWKKGVSGGVISETLGTTRSAVMGRINRERRTVAANEYADRIRKPAHRANHKRPRPTVQRITNHGNRLDVVEVAAPEPLPETPAADNAIPRGQRRTILTLTSTCCHWPVGDPHDPDFFFCGARAITGLPYCAFHARIAYMPPNVRRDRPYHPR